MIALLTSEEWRNKTKVEQETMKPGKTQGVIQTDQAMIRAFFPGFMASCLIKPHRARAAPLAFRVHSPTLMATFLFS